MRPEMSGLMSGFLSGYSVYPTSHDVMASVA
jgi:hypothetical protein